MLKQVKSHRLYALFVIALGTGMRIGEILALHWDNINFDQNELTVCATVYRSKNRAKNGEAIGGSSKNIGAPKTEAGNRVIPLTLEIKQVLLSHREKQIAEQTKAGGAWQNNNLVFCTAVGGYLEYNNITRLFSKYRDTAEISKLNFS